MKEFFGFRKMVSTSIMKVIYILGIVAPVIGVVMKEQRGREIKMGEPFEFSLHEQYGGKTITKFSLVFEYISPEIEHWMRGVRENPIQIALTVQNLGPRPSVLGSIEGEIRTARGDLYPVSPPILGSNVEPLPPDPLGLATVDLQPGDRKRAALKLWSVPGNVKVQDLTELKGRVIVRRLTDDDYVSPPFRLVFDRKTITE